MNITFEQVVTEEQIKVLADTANIVWHDAFKEILTLKQIEYMIEKFQSFNALTEAINKNGYEYYLIKADNNVAGYTGLHEENGKMFLSKLYILKEYRGKQVASKAFEFIENLAKEKKLKSVWLTVNKNNNHAIEVYKHKGFVVIRKQVADIGNGFVMDDYVFEKNL
ncbi:GNAT family N-acetyltransferase [Candidatus Ruminimicrobiellum ovillum]|uniref:GNAT family N-acetyltransferase n=1 Tax=Candidatus Ruminimicrobiellum ovillum TaxID=1947927 RepID=UPI003559ECA2